MTSLKSFEKIDDLHINNYKIIQNKNMFCFGIDTVLLSNFAKIKSSDKVLDLCTGNGIIPILLHGKYKCKNIFGIDILNDNIELAKRSAILNNIQNNLTFYQLDLKNSLSIFQKYFFDVITVNPPYMNNSGFTNKNHNKTIARHEICCTLEDVIENTSNLLKYGGKFFMVHKHNRMGDIFYYMKKYNIEPKEYQLVKSKFNKPPNIILIKGVKFGKPNIIMKNDIIVYDENNNYTEQIKKIYNNN